MSRDTRSAVSILAIVPGQFYTVLRDFHCAPLEEHAQRAFEHFLAHLRPCSDFRRVAVVVQGKRTAVFADHRKQRFRRMAHFGDSLLLQADVDAVVFRDACHVSLQTVAYVDAAEELVAVDHAPVTVVHDHPIAIGDSEATSSETSSRGFTVITSLLT